MASRNDPVTIAFAQHHTIFDGQQHDRQSITRWPQRRDALRARGHPGQRHARGGAV